MAQAEFRGCDNLVCARITQDDEYNYVTGDVVDLAPVASIAKTTEQNSETHFYDNVGLITIKAVGVDTIQLVVPALVLEKLALVTGATIDPSTGAYMSGEDTNYEYALGYRLKLTDGTYRYVWRLKGTFSSVPDEQSDTESNEINTNNQTITFTGTQTVYKFPNVGRRRDVVIDERDGMCNLTTFFNQVVTPKNVYLLSIADVTALSLSPSTLTLAEGETGTVTYSITPATRKPFLTSTNPSVAEVDEEGHVTAKRAGNCYIVATAGTLSAMTSVTVTGD